MRMLLAVFILCAAPAAAAPTGPYTPIPLLHLTGDTRSYVRFINLNQAETVFGASIVGSPSGRFYAGAAVTVPGLASRQYSAAEIFAAAGFSTSGLTDTSYSLYLQNSDALTGYQHVFYNGANGYFENASVCPYFSGQDYSKSNQVLVNVHTSVIQGYPSLVQIHNTTGVAKTYSAIITDANTGAGIKTATFEVPAFGSIAVPFSEVERQTGFTPTAQQNQVNVLVSVNGGGNFGAVLGHSVINLAASVELNLTQWCLLAR